MSYFTIKDKHGNIHEVDLLTSDPDIIKKEWETFEKKQKLNKKPK